MRSQGDQDRDAWADGLIEVGIPPEQMSSSLRTLEAVSRWSPGEPDPAQTERLIAILVPEVGPPTTAGQWERLGDLVAATRAQTMVLTPAFWIASATVMAVGVGLAALGFGGTRSAILYLVGPLLSYLGTSMGFRAIGLGTLELELAAPIGPRQLTLARLLVVVGYQLGIGVILSLLLWGGSVSTAGVMLAWLAPLLSATGLTLALSLWTRVETAGLIVYALWAGAAVLTWRLQGPGASFGVPVEEALAVAGLILLGVAVAIAPLQLGRAPRRQADLA